MDFLPCCTACSAVTLKGNFFLRDSTQAKTAEKLNTCSRCHLDCYCTVQCQKKHFSKHRVSCVQTEKRASPLNIAAMIKKYTTSKTSKIYLMLDSQKNLKEHTCVTECSNRDKLSMHVVLDGQLIERRNYLRCIPDYNWKTKLKNIIEPPIGISTPIAHIDLGLEMIEKGLYWEAFDMIANKTPHQKHSIFFTSLFSNYAHPVNMSECSNYVKNMFFQKAIHKMNELHVDFDEVVACAKILHRNRIEVDVIINPPDHVDLPDAVQCRIEKCLKLSSPQQIKEMVDIAFQIIDLKLYDHAFVLVNDWIENDNDKINFFEKAAKKMVKDVSYEKIWQLGRAIQLSETDVRVILVRIYAMQNVKLACQLAQESVNSDDYLKIILVSLLGQERFDESMDVLNLISLEKRFDLDWYQLPIASEILYKPL